MAPKLNWKPNDEKCGSKALKAFYFLKRNTSASTKLNAKLNVYAVYVVPIVTYATEAWFANKTGRRRLSAFEWKLRVGSLTTGNWITRRCLENSIYFLSLFIELHDILLLIAFLSGNVNIPTTKNQNCVDQPITRQFELININQTTTKKADENFWSRSSQLLNIICNITNLAIESFSKKRLSELQNCTGIFALDITLKPILVPGPFWATAIQYRRSD